MLPTHARHNVNATRLDLDWLAAAIGDDLAAQVSHQKDHHDLEEDAVTRKGRILSIRCASCRYAPTAGADERTLSAAMTGRRSARYLRHSVGWAWTLMRSRWADLSTC